MIWAHELSAAEEKLKENADGEVELGARKDRLKTAQAMFNRLNRTKEERQELDECLPMARALFSEELEKAIETLNRQFWFVQVDIEAYIDDDGKNTDFSKKIRRGMFEVKPAGEANEVTAAVEEAVTTIEGICLPVLRLEDKAA